MSFARSQRSLKLARKRLDSVASDLATLQGDVRAVSSLIPAVGSLLGHRPTKVGRLHQKDITPKHVLFLCRAVSLPASSRLRVGVDMRRLTCAGARLLLDRQRVGISHSSGWPGCFAA